MPVPEGHFEISVKSSAGYKIFREGKFKGIAGVMALYGKKTEDSPMEVLTLFFDEKLWTKEKAQKWVDSHNFENTGEKFVEMDKYEGDAVFRKDILFPGVFNGYDIDKEFIRLLYEQTKKAMSLGYRVFVPERHSKQPADNTGFAMGLMLEGEILYADLAIKDKKIADKIRQGTIQDVSVGIELEGVAVNGEVCKPTLEHIALTMIPAIPGMKPFIQLEMSHANEQKGEGMSEPKDNKTDETLKVDPKELETVRVELETTKKDKVELEKKKVDLEKQVADLNIQLKEAAVTLESVRNSGTGEEVKMKEFTLEIKKQQDRIVALETELKLASAKSILDKYQTEGKVTTANYGIFLELMVKDPEKTTQLLETLIPDPKFADAHLKTGGELATKALPVEMEEKLAKTYKDDPKMLAKAREIALETIQAHERRI